MSNRSKLLESGKNCTDCKIEFGILLPDCKLSNE